MKLSSCFAIVTGFLVLHEGEATRIKLKDLLLQKVKPLAKDVCGDIQATWWEVRLGDSVGDSTSKLDQECLKNKEPETCKQHMNCNWRGPIQSGSCLSNPCQETGGKCIWWGKEQVQAINAQYEKEGKTHMMMPSQGCYRSPCDLQGYGNGGESVCRNESVEGVFSCLWCNKVVKKMGCQMTTVTTEAPCAPVKNRALDGTVFQLTGKGKQACQCSTLFPYCEADVAAGGYKKK